MVTTSEPQKERTALHCFFTNTDSLSNKKNELSVLLHTLKPHIFGISEVFPKNPASSITDQELHIPGYNMMKYRKDGTGLGVALYTDESLSAQEIIIPGDHSGTESIWCSITPNGTKKLLVGCVYRSPSSSAADNQALNNLITAACQLKFDDFCIFGDFNYPDIDWKTRTSPANPDHRATQFYDTVTNDCYLYQHIAETTHHRADQTPSLIDLLFTPDADDVLELEHLPPLGRSHHDVIRFKLATYATFKPSKVTRFKYDEGDYEAMYNELEATDWSEIDVLSVEDAWNLFKHRLHDASTSHIPTKVIDPTAKPRPPWMDSAVLLKIKEKRIAFRIFRKTRSSENKTKWKKLRNEVRKIVRVAAANYEIDLVKKVKTNPKAFFSYAKSKLKPRSAVPDLTAPDGSTVTTSKKKAEVLNDFFSSVFTAEPDEPPATPDPPSDVIFPEVNFDPHIVERKLLNLNPNKSPGPDYLHPRILKETAKAIAGPLSAIFKKSYCSGRLPSEWKDASVSPIFKKGRKSDPGNYRPVSLTCIICKVMESIIRDSILSHLTTNSLLSDHQHGFIPKRSCTTQLLEVLEEWTASLENKHSVDAVYLDFSKAFDSVPHKRLIAKLRSLAIDPTCLRWIKSFLSNRRQYVAVNNEHSDWAPVLSGIPQGSVLGPVLFITYINDMPDAVNLCSIKLFADDAKLFTEVDEAQDASILQSDLTNLMSWSEKWLLKFNTAKCKVLHVGRKNERFTYKMGDVTLSVTECEKDLGVWINQDLTATDHIKNAVSKANKLLGMIRRTFSVMTPEMFSCLFKTLIRPHLEYGFSVWWPKNKGENVQVENVLIKASRRVPGLSHLNYADRLQILNLPSMIYRRYRGDMIQCYKYLHDLYDTKSKPLNSTMDTPYGLRYHNLARKKLSCDHPRRREFFSQRTVNHWNYLPADIVNAPTLNSMKARLDKHWSRFKYSVDSPPFKFKI